jgi:mono/diheme cytochrome c family protein
MRGKLTAVIVVMLIFLIGGGVAAATGQTGNQAANEPFTGKQLYTSYCALCHGSDGKGGGPFSPQLKVWPPDLTQMAKRNHGVFPAMRATEAIDGEFGKPSHGSAEMPIWGPVFRSMAHGHKDSAQVRINSLVKYLESIQEK